MAIKIFLFLAFCIFSVTCEEPELDIPQGRLRGRVRNNWDGEAFYSFQNIPYGKPPVGELRFKAPQPADGWNGTRDATEDLPLCVQAYSGIGQEDCLNLNVYTPGLPSENVAKKPVMVYIYGGAFMAGTAQESSVGPEFLLTKDVVLVALAYRIGIMGFFTLDDPELGVTGNAGLKDQVLAMKWVKENIEYFGGDPDNILIFGISAGSMSVHLQTLSPMSQGLFNKAIAESGTVFTDLVVKQVRNNGVPLAETLGIQTDNWEEMLESLQALSVSEIVYAAAMYDKFFATPIIEIESAEPAFISEDPLDIIRSGNYNQVPLIIGFTDAEGLMFQGIELATTGQSILITDFSEWIPLDLKIEPGSEEEEIVSQRMKHFYYGDEEPNRDDISGAVYLTRDYGFGFPAYRSAIEHLKTSSYPIYFYFFTADTELNGKRRSDAVSAAFPGAAHGDDGDYLFFSSSTPDIEEGSVEELGIRNMVDLWTNFAIHNTPTPDGYDYNWEPVEEGQFNYLHIDTEKSVMEVDPVRENMQFWTEIFEEYFPK